MHRTQQGKCLAGVQQYLHEAKHGFKTGVHGQDLYTVREQPTIQFLEVLGTGTCLFTFKLLYTLQVLYRVYKATCVCIQLVKTGP